MILHATFEPDLELSAVMEDDPQMDAEFADTTQIDGGQYRFSYGLKYDPDTRTVSVDAADAVTAGDTRPVTSAAVQVEIGNIEVLLHTI
jgi:hypothetical protein